MSPVRAGAALSLRAMILGILLTVLAGLGSPASAMDCSKASTQVELAICGNDALRKADAKLSKLYFATLRMLEGARRELLVDSQKLWLKDREQSCIGDVAACVAGSMAERGRQIEACFTANGSEPSNDVACPYFLHRGCPRLEATGSPHLAAYPFLVSRLVGDVKAVEGDFECNTGDASIDITRNSQSDNYRIVAERPGLVCVKIRQEGDIADAAHPNSSEAMRCHDTASTAVIDVATVLPELSAGSEALDRLRAAADGRLQLGCCDPQDTSDATFEDLNSSDPMPTGWAVDDAGNLILGFDQNAFGRLFLATVTLARADFIADVAPAYRTFFTPTRK